MFEFQNFERRFEVSKQTNNILHAELLVASDGGEPTYTFSN